MIDKFFTALGYAYICIEVLQYHEEGDNYGKFVVQMGGSVNSAWSTQVQLLRDFLSPYNQAIAAKWECHEMRLAV